MKDVKIYSGKDGEPNLIISNSSDDISGVFTIKKFLDEQLGGQKPKGFAIEEFYDMETLELQNVTISIEAKNGKGVGIFHEPYDPNFRFRYDKSKREMVFPNQIIYRTQVSRDGRVHSRKLLKKC
jgi:hypothetical protein